MNNFHSYVIGFILCVILTLASYFLVDAKLLSGLSLLLTLGGLAIVQAIAQVIFFLHLQQETNPKWHTHAFVSMVAVVIVIAAGSLWIMYNLDYRLMPAS